MKTTLLCLLGATGLFLAGCESEMPPERGKPQVTFGNDQFREEVYSRPSPPATDLAKTPW